jgi:CheY-like chemotaxis protein
VNETEIWLEDSLANAGKNGQLSQAIGEFLLNRTRETVGVIDDRVRHSVATFQPPPRRLRVLVVEDERDTLLTFAQLFTLFGHDVSFARTPTVAIADSLARPPEVVISDINLPEMDGCELARELSAIAATINGSRPLLVALTGLGDEARERCAEAGFDHFFTKPADPQALERILSEFAGLRASPRRHCA